MKAKYILPVSLLVAGAATYGQPEVREALKVRFSQRQEMPSAEQQQKGALQHSQVGKVEFKTRQRTQNAHRVNARGNMADNLLLYGLKYRDEGGDLAGGPYNVIRFHNAAGTAKYDVSPEITGGKAAFYANGRFYMLSDGGSIKLTSYDAKTWEKLGTDELFASDDFLRQVAAVDPTTGEAYFLLWGEFDLETYHTMRPLYRLNLETKETTLVGKIDNLFIQTMFFDNEGQLYGIPYNENKLFKLDKTSAAVEEVGDMNLPFNRFPYSESACVDPATGIVYWVVPNRANFESYIYTIDPKTAQVELVGDMPNDEHLLGLYIPEVAAAAPAAASGIDYKDGKICFTVPTKTYTTGEDLTGELTAVIDVDGKVLTEAVTAGQEVELAAEIEDGLHAISICVKNEAGEGAVRIMDFYSGVDTPMAVTNIEATANVDGAVTVKWNAPAGSVNGGSFDDAAVRYDVVRMPDQKVVATDLAETTVSDQLPEKHDHYTYVVVAKVSGLVSEEATSNEVIFGNIWVPNYTEQFNAVEDWTLFTVVDKNEDGASFQLMESQNYVYLWGNGAYDPEFNPGGGNGMDDYLITPAIRLEKETEYRFRFDITELGVNEHIGVLLGTSTDVASLTTLKDLNLRWADDNRGLTVYFNVPEDGLYHLALHDDAPQFSASFRLDNMSVDLYSRFEGPAAVTDLKATAGEMGAISNTLSLTAPTKTFKGEALTGKLELVIERNGKQVGKLSDVEPGQQISWQDETVGAGEQNYRVYCLNAAGEGQEALITNWVGLDIPARPVIVSAHQNGAYQPVVSWEAASAQGAHGGYVDPSAVTYLLCKNNPWDFSNPWPVVATTTDLTAADETFISYWGQDNYTYAVFVENEAGVGEGTAFNIILGQPWDTPYSESFSYGFAWNSPWVLHASSYDYAWSITNGDGLAVKPYDETGADGGMLYYTWRANDSNDQMMEGPRVALSNLTKGELSFYMYHGFEADEEDVVLEVYANYNDQGWKKLGDVDYNNGATGWTRSSFKLDTPEAPEGYGPACVQIGFVGVTTVPSASIFIDQIKIEDGVDTDLAMVSVLGDKRIKAGQQEELTFAVANYGMEEVSEYSIDYKVLVAADSSVVLESAVQGTKSLKSGDVCTLTATIDLDLTAAGKSYVVLAKANVLNDEVLDNNEASFNFMVRGSNLPAATELAAVSTNEGVALNWLAPAKSEITDPVTDTFDDYESFIIDSIGDWQVYDGDGCIPVYFGGPSIPHDFDAKAWQIWAPEEAGFSVDRFPVLEPHSGTKYLASWTASDGYSSTLPTDDWLISSEIEGGSDLSFYYRVPNAGSDAQNVEILYSTTDQYPENFEHVDGDAVIGTTEWVKLEYSLPADARYFAIRNWNNGGATTVAFLDDVEYTPLYGSTTELTFVGYRIYRDGEVIADGVQETSFVDEALPGDHTYFVTTVWAEGESNTTNVATVEVITEIGRIEVSEGMELYRVDGTRIEGQATEAGIYLMRQGDKISKVVVR